MYQYCNNNLWFNYNNLFLRKILNIKRKKKFQAKSIKWLKYLKKLIMLIIFMLKKLMLIIFIFSFLFKIYLAILA